MPYENLVIMYLYAISISNTESQFQYVHGKSVFGVKDKNSRTFCCLTLKRLGPQILKSIYLGKPTLKIISFPKIEQGFFKGLGQKTFIPDCLGAS